MSSRTKDEVTIGVVLLMLMSAVVIAIHLSGRIFV